MTAPTVGLVDRLLGVVQTRLRCECFDPDELEFSPSGPCAKCELEQLIEEGGTE